MNEDNIFSNTNSGGEVIGSSGVYAEPLSSEGVPRVYPRQISTGAANGNINVGYGNVSINGTSNTITLTQSIGTGSGATITIGQQTSSSTQSGVASSSISSTNTSFGFSTTDVNNNVLLVGVLNNGDIGLSISNAAGNQNIAIDGTKGYQLFTNPSTQISQIVIGLLPDNTYGMVISKTGVQVLSVFT